MDFIITLCLTLIVIMALAVWANRENKKDYERGVRDGRAQILEENNYRLTRLGERDMALIQHILESEEVRYSKNSRR